MRRAFGHSLTGSHFVLEGWAFHWWTCKSQSQLPWSSPWNIKPCLSRCACLRLLAMSPQCKQAFQWDSILTKNFSYFKGHLFWYKSYTHITHLEPHCYEIVFNLISPGFVFPPVISFYVFVAKHNPRWCIKTVFPTLSTLALTRFKSFSTATKSFLNMLINYF